MDLSCPNKSETSIQYIGVVVVVVGGGMGEPNHHLLLCGGQGLNEIKHSFVDEKCLQYNPKKSGKWKKTLMNSFWNSVHDCYNPSTIAAVRLYHVTAWNTKGHALSERHLSPCTYKGGQYLSLFFSWLGWYWSSLPSEGLCIFARLQW